MTSQLRELRKNLNHIPLKLIRLIESYLDIPVQYMAYHKRVRNDDHCPVCRTYYISFHVTLEDALEEITSELSEEEKDENTKILELGNSLWIDEWIRRSNGDLYQICGLHPKRRYDMSAPDLDLETEEEFTPSYFRLNFKLNGKECCPDNIQCFLKFYETYGEAKNAVRKGVWEDDHCWWYSKKKQRGIYYHVIPIEAGKIYFLHDYCKYVQRETWDTLF